MDVDWTPIRSAMACTRRMGVDVPIWWRDDDAIEPSDALDRLHGLSVELNMPVHIAVIPELAHTSLADFVSTRRHLVPLVHGWRHENTAPPGAKKAEFGTVNQTGAANIHAGMTRMSALFGWNFLPIFVPPWNRFDRVYLPDLKDAGFQGLSTFSARANRLAASGLVQINTHVDPVDWHETRGLKNPSLLVEQTAKLLMARLSGENDASEPLGYLTHHLVHTDELWDFSRQLLSELLQGGAHVQPLAPLLESSQ